MVDRNPLAKEIIPLSMPSVCFPREDTKDRIDKVIFF
jgi:hypothetical protein